MGFDHFVRQAPVARITPTRRVKPTREGQLTIAFGDAQIPFHDETALKLGHLAVRELMPDNIVLVGDMLDLPSLSRFQQRPEWQGRTQQAIDRYHQFLAQLRADAPQARIIAVHGNHEQRLDNYVQRNAAELLGLKRANAPKELGVLTIQNLCRYDELGVEAVDGYPNGSVWLEDNLKFIHGTNTAKGGSNAAKYLREERETTIYGHSHRMEVAYRTFNARLGSVTIAAASPGCLSLVDGTVPGFNHTINNRGEVVQKAEDWQQGLLLIQHTAEGHDITPVRFQNGGMNLLGKHYEV